MVPKADGTLRLCTEFRKINAVTVPDPFPLPHVEDLLDKVGKAQFLTKLDMTRGYWQIPSDKDRVPISAFVTLFGHFQWSYMFFEPLDRHDRKKFKILQIQDGEG